MSKHLSARSRRITEHLLGGGVFLLPTLVILFQTAQIAPTSLWADELYSVSAFSAKGPLTALTHYPVPNNHIFFNFLNSLLPDSDSYHPLRARFLSLSALALTLGVLGVITFRYRRPFIGAAVLAVIASTPYLDLIIQARGYGFLSCISLLQCALVLRFFSRTDDNWSLLLLAFLSVVGVWTVPSYLFFAAPLHLFLLPARFSLSVFLAGAAAAIGIAAAYSPVFTQLLESTLTYKNIHGAHFTEFKSLYQLPRTYLSLHSEAWSAAIAALLIGAGFLLKGGERKAYLVLLASAIALLIITLLLTTPLPRTIAFILVPVSFLTGLVLQRAVQLLPYSGDILLLFFLFAATGWYSNYRVSDFNFVPIESWKETAAFLEEEFPANARIHAPFRVGALKNYTTKDFEWVNHFDREEFAAGNLIVVENDFKDRKKIVPEEEFLDLRAHNIPQRRGGAQRVLWIENSTAN